MKSQYEMTEEEKKEWIAKNPILRMVVPINQDKKKKGEQENELI